MRTDRFNGILLSILLTVSLIAPAITTITLLSVSLVSANPGPSENIIRASDTAYNRDGDTCPLIWKWYGPDEEVENRPVVMAAKRVDLGAVVAAGLARTANDYRWNDTDPVNTHPYLDNLFDKVFQWMSGKAPSATKVLWYGEYAQTGNYEYVYNDSNQCSMLITALRTSKGYTIDNTRNGSFTPITAGLLDPYDILVIPQLQLGAEGTGGDDDLLPDGVVAVIDNFVRNGRGLLILEGSDFAAYNFANVQNKILRALDMGIYFQSDSIDDDTNYWGGGANYFQPLIDVDNTTWIGSAFENEMGGKTIGLYAVSSLALRGDYEVSMGISPKYQSGFPSTTIKYTVSVIAAGWEDDNINLSVDNVWPATLGTTRLEDVGPDGKETTLSVTIPSGTAFGDEDEITVTATSQGNPSASIQIKVKAIASMRIGPPMEDTYTTQEPDERGTPWNAPRGGYIWMYVGSDRDNNKRIYLKFDLRGIPEGLIPPDGVQIDDIQARLFLWCEVLPTAAAAGKNVNVYAVDDDDWHEMEMWWGDNEPAIGALLDTTKVDQQGYWYSWDVTSHVINEYKNDNIASFSMRAETENFEGIDAFGYYSFTPTNATDTWKHPYLIIGYDVSTWISPDYDGIPGGTLTYNVNVWNKGSFADNYDLYIENEWETTLEDRVLNVQPMEVRPAALTVKIPEGAQIGDYDNILITAVSERSGENDNGWCIARASTHVSAWEDSSTRGRDDPPSHLENSVWGTVDGIYVGRYSEAPERGWLKFDLRAFPPGTTITRATLNLNAYSTYGANVRVYGVGDDSWSEYTINWLNKPAIDTDNALDTRAVFENDKWYSWDVTDFVANQYAGDQIVSFCLVDVGENVAPNHDARFSSKDYTDNWPYLEILATVPDREVRAYADTIFQGGLVGDTLTYTITVVNKGTLDDNYDLTVENTQPWIWTLENSFLWVPAGESSRTTKLSVTIPSGAFCTINDITITVTSRANPAIYDKIRAQAHRSKVWFVNKEGSGPDKLRTLYEVWLDMNVLLRDDASELVLKFYTWGGNPQGENVVSRTMPVKLENEYPDVWKNPHPQGKGVENVKLILRDAQGTTVQTITTFIVTKTTLETRFMEIPGEWFLNPPLRTQLELEFSKIPSAWFLAPD